MKKKFHIFYFCPDTKETKIKREKYNSFSEAASHAYIGAHVLREKTHEQWEVCAIYDLTYDFGSQGLF